MRVPNLDGERRCTETGLMLLPRHCVTPPISVKGMQTRAIIEAVCQLQKEGMKVVPEMIPLVGLVKELRDQKAVVNRVAAEGDERAEGPRSSISSAR